MANELITREQPALRLRSPEDLLAAVPYIVGFHPSDSLVAVGFTGPHGRVTFTTRVDLPEPGDTTTTSAAADHVAAILDRQQVRTATLVAYGRRGRAEELAMPTRQRLVDLGVSVPETLWVEGDRYGSLTCEDPQCCPPQGKPYDAAASGVAAEATLAGLVALPDREALVRSLAPVEGSDRVVMQRATERAEAQLEEWAAEESGPDGLFRRMVDEGRSLLRDALDRQGPVDPESGGTLATDQADTRLSVDEVALLGTLLTLDPIRDEAWVLIDTERRAAHLALWTDVVRLVDPGYAAAPACLLAFAAWQDGDGARAWVALDRALQADREYSMALLLGSALARGVPPVAWPQMSVADVRRAYDRADPPAPVGRTRVRRRRPDRRSGAHRRRPRSRRQR